MPARERVGIGIQLASLQPKIIDLCSQRILYRANQDFEIKEAFELGNERRDKMVQAKEGDFFYVNKSINEHDAFFYSQGVSFHYANIDESKYTEIDKKDLTLQEMSDLLPRRATLIDGCYPSQKSKPFECAYVVCPRDVQFSKLLVAIKKHIQQKQVFIGSEDYYVWIDIFCTREFQDIQAANEEKLKKTLDSLKNEMSKFEEVLIYFDSIQNPKTLSRLWCIWELYAASKAAEKTPFALIFPKKVPVNDDLLINFDNLIERVMGLDPTLLKSHNSSTEMIMKQQLTNLPHGFYDVILTIRDTLCSWLTNIVLREYSLTTNIEMNYLHHIDLFVDTALFLYQLVDNYHPTKDLYHRRASKDTKVNIDKLYSKIEDLNNENRELEAHIDKEYMELRTRIFTNIIHYLQFGGEDEYMINWEIFENKMIEYAEEKKIKNEFPITPELLRKKLSSPEGKELFLHKKHAAQFKAKNTNQSNDKPPSRDSTSRRGAKILKGTMVIDSRGDYQSNQTDTSKFILGSVESKSPFEKLLDVQIAALICKGKFQEVIDLAQVWEEDNQQDWEQDERQGSGGNNKKLRLYGGLSLISLYLKQAERLAMSPDLQKDVKTLSDFEESLKSTFEQLYKDKDVQDSRPFLEKRMLSYLVFFYSLDPGLTAKKAVKKHYGFKSFNILTVDNKFDHVGCSTHSALVFYIIGIKEKDKNIELIADSIAKSVYGKEYGKKKEKMKKLNMVNVNKKKTKNVRVP